MHVDLHQAMRQLVDKSLAGAASPQEQQKLQAHLVTCVPCQEYLDASNRAIAGLAGFSFEVDPGLQGKVMTSVAFRAQQLELRHTRRLPLGWSYLVALMLTVVGSLAAVRSSGFASAAFHLEPEALRLGVLALWIVPSLFFCLLFPILHRLSTGGMNEKGLSE